MELNEVKQYITLAIQEDIKWKISDTDLHRYIVQWIKNSYFLITNIRSLINKIESLMKDPEKISQIELIVTNEISAKVIHFKIKVIDVLHKYLDIAITEVSTRQIELTTEKCTDKKFLGQLMVNSITQLIVLLETLTKCLKEAPLFNEGLKPWLKTSCSDLVQIYILDCQKHNLRLENMLSHNQMI